LDQPKVLHIISGLDTGGAEMMLYKLIVQSSRQGIDSKIISIKKLGPMAKKIEEVGIEVDTLNIGKSFWHTLISLPLLIWKTKKFQPHVIQGWMYHGNLFATISSLCVSSPVILCWNIRQTLYDIKREKIFTRWTIWICKILSKVPNHILYNSSLSAQQHEGYGYSENRRTIIFNGFETEEFKPNIQLKSEVKKELNIKTRYVVGHIARFHPKKDHKTFISAAKKVVDEIEDVTFVLIGRNVLYSTNTLAQYVKQLGVEAKVQLLGERTDIARVLTAMDVVVSSSGWGEGFSNVIGEAMAAGSLCVVTDIGEAKDIVGNIGIVVPPYSVDAISKGVIQFLKYSDEVRDDISRRGRERIIEEYSIDKIAEKYLNIYRRQ
jgi:glycosyltransferase involved in cell wall biosynthesis